MTDITALSDAGLADLRQAIDAEVARRAARAAAAGPKTAAPPGCEWWPVVTGCVDQSVIGYCDHRRGKNWVATVQAAPGGLSRDFWTKASTSWVHVPVGLAVGDVVEIAHEYSTAGGRSDRQREYVEILVIQTGSGDQRIGFRRTQKPDRPRVKPTAAPAAPPQQYECLECGGVFDDPSRIRSHGMGCDR